MIFVNNSDEIYLKFLICDLFDRLDEVLDEEDLDFILLRFVDDRC